MLFSASCYHLTFANLDSSVNVIVLVKMELDVLEKKKKLLTCQKKGGFLVNVRQPVQWQIESLVTWFSNNNLQLNDPVVDEHEHVVAKNALDSKTWTYTQPGSTKDPYDLIPPSVGKLWR